MFGNKKKENSSPKRNGVVNAGSSHALNTLVAGTEVEGTITCNSDIRIDGTVKGSLHCNAKLIIGPEGFVDGDVICNSAMIEGRFEGTLKVAELLNVRETARINGDITTKQLIVQSGAVFSVSCKMGAQASSNGTINSQPSANNIGKTSKKASEVRS